MQKNGGNCTSAIFPIPKNNFFASCTDGMKFMGQYTAEQVYIPGINPHIRRPSLIEAYLCDNFCVPPPPPYCNLATLNAGSLTMQFDALINQAGRTPLNNVNVLLDSGATHNFMPLALSQLLNIKLTPSSYNSTGLGNGKDCNVLGECVVSLEIQGVRDTIKCLVLSYFMSGIDLILGNHWHKFNDAVMNFKEESVCSRACSRSHEVLILDPCG